MAIDLWLAAADGDASGMALLSMTRNMLLPNMFVWGEAYSKAGSVDDFYGPARDYRTELGPPDSALSAPWSLWLWGMMRGWPNTFSPPEARTHLLSTFFDTGEVDTSLYRRQAVNFDVGLGWPGLAKVLLGIVLAVIILLVALVGLVVRRVWRRRPFHS